MKKQFKYRSAQKIVNWGCSFDSLTEMKFAVSIMEEYQFLRGRVTIYYHRKTKLPTAYLRDDTSHYIPDFLIRHKQTREAFLIEVKPRAFENDPQLALRKEVAENYIRWKGYDWKYKVIFDDEIILSSDQLEEFDHCRKLAGQSARKLWFEEYNKRFDRTAPSFFKGVPKESDIRFIMFGMSQAEFNFFSR